MSIPDHHVRNFRTLIAAAEAGDLALMECTDARTGELRYVLCGVGRDSRGYAMTPFGHLAEGNPFETYVTPPDRSFGRAATAG
ncbi:MAG: hypothetical protein C0494_05815 [Sphingobium sp.]|nr:hypothetical protein [Sphingobium sp.]